MLEINTMEREKYTMERTRVVDRTFISKEALESLVKQTKEYYVSVWKGHDPRFPPIGRVVDAELVKTGEDSYEAVGEIEFFDETMNLNEIGDKELYVKEYSNKYLQIFYDKNFLDKEDQAIISEIAELFKSEARKEEKHCIEHVAIISICASFVFGSIAAGFLKKLGEDSYLSLKNKLSELFQKKKDENVLTLELSVEKDGYSINTEIFLNNPTSSEIEYMLNEGIKEIESKLLPSFYDKSLGIKRLVYEQKNKNIHLKFAVRKDGIPMKLEVSEKQK